MSGYACKMSNKREEEFENTCNAYCISSIFTKWSNWSTPNPWPKGHKLHNFGALILIMHLVFLVNFFFSSREEDVLNYSCIIFKGFFGFFFYTILSNHLQVLWANTRLRIPESENKKTTTLEEVSLLILTTYSAHMLDVQETWRKCLKNLCDLSIVCHQKYKTPAWSRRHEFYIWGNTYI